MSTKHKAPRRAIGVRLNPETLARIQRISKTTGEHVTAVLRRLVEERLKRAA